jgi:predicted nucleotidyltransferase
MTWRVSPFDRSADEIVRYARETYAPTGIVISGSIVRGEAGPRSDLDVFVVHDQPWRATFQPRRKVAVEALAEIDPSAASLVRAWSTMPAGPDALRTVEQLVRHVLGVDTFFEWSSSRDPVLL